MADDSRLIPSYFKQISATFPLLLPQTFVHNLREAVDELLCRYLLQWEQSFRGVVLMFHVDWIDQMSYPVGVSYYCRVPVRARFTVFSPGEDDILEAHVLDGSVMDIPVLIMGFFRSCISGADVPEHMMTFDENIGQWAGPTTKSRALTRGARLLVRLKSIRPFAHGMVDIKCDLLRVISWGRGIRDQADGSNLEESQGSVGWGAQNWYRDEEGERDTWNSESRDQSEGWGLDESHAPTGGWVRDEAGRQNEERSVTGEREPHANNIGVTPDWENISGNRQNAPLSEDGTPLPTTNGIREENSNPGAVDDHSKQQEVLLEGRKPYSGEKAPSSKSSSHGVDQAGGTPPVEETKRGIKRRKKKTKVVDEENP